MLSVLVVAMVLTLGVWLFTGYSFLQRVRLLEAEAEAVTARYAAAEALLADIRHDLDRAAITLRDALIDTRPGLQHYRTQVDTALETADGRLAAYEPVLGSNAEHEHINRLRTGIQQLRRANHDFLAIDAGQWGSTTAAALLDRVTPKRDAAIRVSNDLQRLNRDAYLAHQAEMARLHGAMQQRSWQALVFGALVGIVIGLVATVRVGRLERQLRARQQQDAATAVALQDLSARLVNAQEEERQHIARELHDGVGQLLTALKLELGQAERRGAGIVSLGDARALADEALTAVRDVSHLLHPPELEQLGLIEAIRAYVQAIARRQEIAIEFTCLPLGRRLPPAAELAAYRIVQEAVTNVLRHASATRCGVSLSPSGNNAVLTIADDGVGFQPDAGPDAPRSGLGLTGIRERVVQAGGVLTVKSAPGCGTMLIAEFPLPGAQSGATVGGAPVLAPVQTG